MMVSKQDGTSGNGSGTSANSVATLCALFAVSMGLCGAWSLWRRVLESTFSSVMHPAVPFPDK